MKTYGYEQTVGFLSETIGSRVIDGTYGPRPPDLGFSALTRWQQILGHVQQLYPDRWLALDDDDCGWPERERHRLVLTPPRTGLLDADVQRRAGIVLGEVFGASVAARR